MIMKLILFFSHLLKFNYYLQPILHSLDIIYLCLHRCVRIRDPVFAAGSNVLHPGRPVERKRKRGFGGRRGCLCPDWQQPHDHIGTSMWDLEGLCELGLWLRIIDVSNYSFGWLTIFQIFFSVVITSKK